MSDANPRNKHLSISKSKLGKFLELKVKGISNKDIAKSLNVSTQAINNTMHFFRPFLKVLENVEYYKTARGEVLSGVEFQLLHELLNPDKLAKATTNQLAYAFTAIHNARRLEEGKSTSNTEIHTKVTQLAETIDITDL